MRLNKRLQGFHVALSDVGSIGKLLYYFYNLQTGNKISSMLLAKTVQYIHV